MEREVLRPPTTALLVREGPGYCRFDDDLFLPTSKRRVSMIQLLSSGNNPVKVGSAKAMVLLSSGIQSAHTVVQYAKHCTVVP